MKYECKYTYESRFGHIYHNWTMVGARLGVNLHIVDMGEDAKIVRYSGGIEFHWRSPPEYMRNEVPSHKNCGVLGGPCWHDGSSMQASEFWIPAWKEHQNDHDRMFKMLQVRLEEETF